MAPLPGVATSTAALVAVLASCGLWVRQEDFKQPILSQASIEEASTPHDVTFAVAESTAPPMGAGVMGVQPERLPEVTGVWWHAILRHMWIFVLVDAVLIGASCILIRKRQRLVSAACLWWHRGASKSPASNHTALVASSGNSSCAPRAHGKAELLTKADSIVGAPAGGAGSTQATAASSDDHFAASTSAGAAESPSGAAVASLRSASPLRPSPTSTPSKQATSPVASTPERRTGSRGASSRIRVPKGVDQWLASRRSPTSKTGASDIDDSKCVELTPVGKKSGYSPAAKAVQQPKGVQEWLSRHQSPLSKASSLDEAAIAGGATTPSRSAGGA